MSKKITFVLNKLVRDKLYDDMVRMDQELDARVLYDEEIEESLLDKLEEELEELRSGDDEDPVDLGSVILAYAKVRGYSVESFLEAINEREEKRGAFDDRRFISSISLDADDPWVEYYRKDPEKYPEI